MPTLISTQFHHSAHLNLTVSAFRNSEKQTKT